jgi:sugar lactone lactonase YvrE
MQRGDIMKSKYLSPILIIYLFFFIFTEKNAYGQSNNFELIEILYSDHKWTGVAVSQQGRKFVNFPRWSSIPFSVVEVVDSQLVPYPDTEWNTWNASTPPENHFVCVQSVYIDKENNLWILDPASISGTVVPGGAKLIKVDLQTDSITQIIYFDNQIAPGQSYLNDVRVDTLTNYAYITESGLGAIIVVDLNQGISRRLLQNHFSTKAENITLNINGQPVNFVIHADGLALTNDGTYLYYKALTGRNLYRIEAASLRDTTLTNTQLENAVEFVMEAMPCDAIEFDPAGHLYFTSIEDNSIYRMMPGDTLSLVLSDDRLKWPDSFSITPGGDIYVTTSRIFFPPGPHGLFQIKEISTAIPGDDQEKMNGFRLYQNYPNPFNPVTTIHFQLSAMSDVELTIYNQLGQRIRTLIKNRKPAGTYKI